MKVKVKRSTKVIWFCDLRGVICDDRKKVQYLKFLAHLVYQPKSLIQSCFVHHHWHRHHWRHLCTPPPVIGLDIETSYLLCIYTYIPHICTLNIYWFWLVVFKWQPFWCFSWICSSHIDSLRDFILHILMYLFFTFIQKRNNANVPFFLKFMSIF